MRLPPTIFGIIAVAWVLSCGDPVAANTCVQDRVIVPNVEIDESLSSGDCGEGSAQGDVYRLSLSEQATYRFDLTGEIAPALTITNNAKAAGEDEVVSYS